MAPESTRLSTVRTKAQSRKTSTSRRVRVSTESSFAAATEFSNQNLEVLFSAEHIAERVRELGVQITRDYASSDLILVGLLKGSWIFLADLVRAIDLRLTVDFMAVSSYNDGTRSTGDIEIVKDLMKPIRYKDVIVVVDMVETGITVSRLLELLGTRGANSVKVASLLDKPEPRIMAQLKINYTGFIIPNKTVVGYGLDMEDRYRNLPFLSVLNDES